MLDRVGEVHGRLTVVAYAGKKWNCPQWECKCECGNTHFVLSGALKRTHSCGCLQRELLSQRTSKTVDMVKATEMYYNGYTLDEIAAACGNITRSGISKKLYKYGVSERETALRPVSGPENPAWKGGRPLDDNGYALVKCVGHPRAAKRSHYVREHLLIMEQSLGRYLIYYEVGHPDNEVVHHINSVKDDNRLENLRLMTHRGHMALHGKVNIKNITEYNVRRRANVL